MPPIQEKSRKHHLYKQECDEPSPRRKPGRPKGRKSLQCSECSKEFNDSCKLKTHMLTHTKERPFPCAQCDKRFTTAGNLKKHSSVHEGDKCHVCEYCNKGFVDISALKRHITTHTGEKKHICSVCDKTFTRTASLTCHMYIHTGVSPHVCSKCGKGFAYASRLKDHMRLYHTEFPDPLPDLHVCSQCGKSFQHLYSLKRHMTIHTRENTQVCDLCGKKFSSRVCLDRHMSIHTGEKPHTCSQCGEAFRLKAQLNIHILNHSGKKKHLCPVCGKGFNVIHRFNSHLEAHNSASPKVQSKQNEFLCQQCGNIFKTHQNLKNHPLSVHKLETSHQQGTDKRFLCQHCRKGFKYSHHLKDHMSSHTEDKPHQCHVCGKHTKSSVALRQHLMTHSGRKPYTCTHCKQTFSHIGGLKKHTYIHTGEKPFVCQICGKGFRQKINLQTHVYTHTGEKPYRCRLCKKGFTQLTNLKKHITKHPGITFEEAMERPKRKTLVDPCRGQIDTPNRSKESAAAENARAVTPQSFSSSDMEPSSPPKSDLSDSSFQSFGQDESLLPMKSKPQSVQESSSSVDVQEKANKSSSDSKKPDTHSTTAIFQRLDSDCDLWKTSQSSMQHKPSSAESSSQSTTESEGLEYRMETDFKHLDHETDNLPSSQSKKLHIHSTLTFFQRLKTGCDLDKSSQSSVHCEVGTAEASVQNTISKTLSEASFQNPESLSLLESPFHNTESKTGETEANKSIQMSTQDNDLELPKGIGCASSHYSRKAKVHNQNLHKIGCDSCVAGFERISDLEDHLKTN